MYGLKEDQIVQFSGILHTNKSEGTVKEAVDFLQNVYTKTLSAEFTHLEVKGSKESIRYQSNHNISSANLLRKREPPVSLSTGTTNLLPLG